MRLYFIGGGDIANRELKEIDNVIISNTDKKNILIFSWTTDDQEKLDKYCSFMTSYFKKLGINDVVFASLDDSAENLKKKISNSSMIYIPGGNTEYLLQRIKEKDLSRMLRTYDRIIAGNSAGALAMCREVILTKDKDTPRTKVVEGMGLVDFSVDVHYNEIHEKELLELSKGRNIYAIPERCALVYDNGRVSFIGDGYLFSEGKKKKVL